MILLTILALILIAVILIGMLLISVFGAGIIYIFGDVIVCVVFIALLMGWLIKRKRR